MATQPSQLSLASGAIVPADNGATGGAPRPKGPVVLSLDAGNYTKWAIYMRASLGRVGLIGHVEGTTAAAPRQSRVGRRGLHRPQRPPRCHRRGRRRHGPLPQPDHAPVVARHPRALLRQQGQQAIYLDFDFRQLVQGTSSVTEYYRNQKKIADTLAENDSPVSDHMLVLNTLHGLGPRFSSAATMISMTDPLPTFLCVWSMLLMEKMPPPPPSSPTPAPSQWRAPA
ncbi:unnamed protein product [Alopecurus aequalis]